VQLRRAAVEGKLRPRRHVERIQSDKQLHTGDDFLRADGGSLAGLSLHDSHFERVWEAVLQDAAGLRFQRAQSVGGN